MDLNGIFIPLVIFASVLNLIRILRAPAIPFGWVVVYAGILIVTVAGMVLIPSWAGILGFWLWMAFAVAPSLGMRLVSWLSLAQRYDHAHLVARMIAALHPADGFPQVVRMMRGLELSSAGRFEEGARLLGEAAAGDAFQTRFMMLQLFKMRQEWERVRELLAEIPEHLVARDPQLLSMWIRCLGETGDLNQMLECYLAYEETLAQPGMLAMARLSVLALTGRREAVEQLLEGELRPLSADMKELWRATSDIVHGERERGLARLAAVEHQANALGRIAIERRRHVPLSSAAVLEPHSADTLAAMERAVDQESRFSSRGDRAPVCTYGLMAAVVFCFGLQKILSDGDDFVTLLRMGAVLPAAVLAGGWWRLLAAQFLHYDLTHLTFNVLALYILGPFVERAVGRYWFLIAYLGSGAAAFLGIVLYAKLGFMSLLTSFVGASAGIMGLIGITASLMLRCWLREGAQLAFTRMRGAIAVVIFQTVLDFFTPQVSLGAHLCGAIAGLIIGFFLPHRLGTGTEV